tara:strand:+ start:265 stop:606 length:342 start_codon:yes stop_codon:yes gene_type:complete
MKPRPPNYSRIGSKKFTRNNIYVNYENLLELEVNILLTINKINTYFNTYFNTVVICDRFTIRNMTKDIYDKLFILLKNVLNFISIKSPSDKLLNSNIIDKINQINIIFDNSLK